MNPILKNTLALVVGIICGAVVNMGIITISGSIIPPPEGADLTTEEGLKEAMKLMEAKHFIMPFLAHALGSFVGAVVAVAIAASHKMLLAFVIALLFFLGGAYMVMILPSPIWFNITDLILAYFPMAYLGIKLSAKKQSK